MKLEKKYLNKCYHDALILQYKEDLIYQGYMVNTEMQPPNKNFIIDLYAEKGKEKKIYEFKIIGGKEYHKGQLSALKQYAKELGAELLTVYVNPPAEKFISFDDLDEMLTEYFCSTIIPPEIDELATHASIDSIDVEELLSVKIERYEIAVTGEAVININLQYGSDSDLRHGDGVETSTSLPMYFTVTLDEDFAISDVEYEIDTDEWYGLDD